MYSQVYTVKWFCQLTLLKDKSDKCENTQQTHCKNTNKTHNQAKISHTLKVQATHNIKT